MKSYLKKNLFFNKQKKDNHKHQATNWNKPEKILNLLTFSCFASKLRDLESCSHASLGQNHRSYQHYRAVLNIPNFCKHHISPWTTSGF